MKPLSTDGFLLTILSSVRYIQKWLKPGMKLIDVCEHLEGVARTLVEEKGLEAGRWRGEVGGAGKCVVRWEGWVSGTVSWEGLVGV